MKRAARLGRSFFLGVLRHVDYEDVERFAGESGNTGEQMRELVVRHSVFRVVV